NLNFENLKVFKVNRITASVNSDSMVYVTKKGLGSILNLFSFGALGKLGGTPANVLANKMVQVALGEPDMKPEYQPKDY
uniref:hypothetical protein n=1 Tax=Umezakia ovalisporum TaxID=75695 RepID=UPI0039C60395